jgi:hypothetical protein
MTIPENVYVAKPPFRLTDVYVAAAGRNPDGCRPFADVQLQIDISEV